MQLVMELARILLVLTVPLIGIWTLLRVWQQKPPFGPLKDGESARRGTVSIATVAGLTGVIGAAAGFAGGALNIEFVYSEAIKSVQVAEKEATKRLKDVQVLPPLGSIIAWHPVLFPETALPKGWVRCDGQTIHQKDYPALHVSELVLPDLNGEQRFLRGGAISGDMGDAATSTGFRDGGTSLDAHQHETPINNWSSVGAYAVGAPWETGTQSGETHSLLIYGWKKEEQQGKKTRGSVETDQQSLRREAQRAHAQCINRSQVLLRGLRHASEMTSAT